MVLVVSPAWAATAPGDLAQLAVPWLLAAAALAAALVLWVAGRRAAARQATALQAADRSIGDLEVLVAAAPAGSFHWTDDGTGICSPRLAAALGGDAARLVSLERLSQHFEPGGFDAIRDGTTTLRATGAPFEATVRSRTGGVFEVTGVHVAGGHASHAVLWFHDVSARAGEVDRLAGRLARAEAERDRLAALADAAPVPAWRRGADLALADVNAAYARLVGGDTTAGGDPVLAEIESARQPGQARALAARARAAGAVAAERRHYVLDGQRRTWRIVEQPDPAGEGTLGHAVDVSELEEAEAQLVRHGKAQAQVLDQLTTAIAIFGADRRLAFFNAAYARLWRYDEDWLATGPLHAELLDAARENRLLPEEADYPAYKRRVMAAYTDLFEPQESLMYLPNGTSLRTVTALHPFGGLIQIFEDVTDRLRLERSYNTLIAVQRETLDNLDEGIAVFGGDGRLKLFNPAFARMWKLEPRWLEGEPHVAELTERLQPLFADRVPWDILRETLIANVTERIATHRRLERPDGTVVDASGVPLPDRNMLYTYLDVTDSVNVERALRERNLALETADQLKSEFIANISYELRTPLNIIIGFAEILTHEYFGPLNERQAEYGKGVLESSYQLLALINDILDLAGFEAGQFALEIQEVDLHATLASVLAMTRERARKSRLTLEFDCPTDVGVIEADDRRLKQVLMNLMSNALKFTPPAGRILLGARTDGEWCEIWVADTGVGISEEERANVFEKFQRGRAANRGQGAGLGLSLARSIVELHGGRISLESEAGNGTRVTCHLPARQAGDRAAAAS